MERKNIYTYIVKGFTTHKQPYENVKLNNGNSFFHSFENRNFPQFYYYYLFFFALVSSASLFFTLCSFFYSFFFFFLFSGAEKYKRQLTYFIFLPSHRFMLSLSLSLTLYLYIYINIVNYIINKYIICI